MKHAGAEALDRLEVLLRKIRACGVLREPRRGVFYLKSRAFLHFHEDPAGLFADIRAADGGDFDRLPVNDEASRGTLLERVVVEAARFRPGGETC